MNELVSTSSFQLSEVASQVPLYRVLHEWERGESLFRKAVPEVYTLEPSKPMDIDKDLQLLWFELFRSGAPSLSEELAIRRWISLLDYKKAFSNGQGFNEPDDPRANWITGENLDKENPKLDKVRVCGGATVTGEIEKGYKWYNSVTEDHEVSDVLWIKTLHPNNLPSLLDLWETPEFYYHATVCYRRRTGAFPNGQQIELGIYEPTLVPLISPVPVYYPMKWLQPVNEIADPYKFYL